MYFETEAYIDEYIIDGENIGILAGDNTRITYTPENPDTSPSVSIPTDEITSVTFKRDTTLQHNRILGWFFAVITLVLILVVYMFSFAGTTAGLTNPDVDYTTFFLVVLIIGGISITHDYFDGEDYDIIYAHVRTDVGDSHVFTGRMKNTEFVQACRGLIESDIETQNRNTELESELSDSQ